MIILIHANMRMQLIKVKPTAIPAIVYELSSGKSWRVVEANVYVIGDSTVFSSAALTSPSVAKMANSPRFFNAFIF